MRSTQARSRVLVGLAATAGAFGAAAMMSAATAPSAHADDFSDIISAVNGDFTEGNDAFASALSDFGSNDINQGLLQIVNGFDDYSLSPVYNLEVGTVEALIGDTINGPASWGLVLPTDFADGLSVAQSFFNLGETFFTDAASSLASADYLNATSEEISGVEFVSIIPLEELLLGGAASF
jgi:hypothetical protein